MSADDREVETEPALILDYLPHGRADDDRPQYQKSTLTQGVDRSTFTLFEFVLGDDSDVGIGDEVRPERGVNGIEEIRRIDFDDLSGGARSELEHVITDLVETEEDRFVAFFNEAQPITLRLHQLTLLPGIGDKLRDAILDQRKRQPFETFEELQRRVSGLHDPQGTIAERIMEELRDEDVKYKLFVRER
ncbi:MAG: DUF655 domain-containing protein [Halobacteriales archaeon]|nr:DUF655 domain-containing protein [Halobacteriales archaeon]